jgi:hypothetical protein
MTFFKVRCLINGFSHWYSGSRYNTIFSPEALPYIVIIAIVAMTIGITTNNCIQLLLYYLAELAARLFGKRACYQNTACSPIAACHTIAL